MPHHQATAHGYIIRKLVNPAQWQQAVAVLGALQLPAGTSFGTISVMQDDNNHPANPAIPGDTVILTVHTSGPSANTPAHQNIQAVAGLVDGSGHTKVIAGLANHWCCYSDQ